MVSCVSRMSFFFQYIVDLLKCLSGNFAYRATGYHQTKVSTGRRMQRTPLLKFLVLPVYLHLTLG